MDNRLTKRRLSDLFAYDWIITLVAIAATIVVWELIYTVSAVRISVGQDFKYYYDEDLYVYETDGSFYNVLGYVPNENGKTFSYDVLSVGAENLMSSYNVLSVRLSVQEGDAIFTSSKEKEDGSVRAKTIADSFSVYDFNKLYKDAEDYLKPLLNEGETDVFDFSLYDTAKIDALFNKRMKSDNRYRTEEQKIEGRLLERGRIEKLVKELKDFKYLLEIGEEKGLFFRYTKYEQSAIAAADTRDEETMNALLQREINNGRENAIYGINLSALTYAAGAQGKKDASEFFKLNDNATAENVVLMLFDFLEDQKDLQFETISFLNTVVRTFSDFLDA